MEDNVNKEERKTLHLYRQTLTSLAPIMATIGIGATFGYSAILLPQLKANTNTITNESIDTWNEIRLTTVEEESWIASSAVILMAPGCWISGYSMEKFGRKRSQMIIGPIYLAAWIGVGLSQGFWSLITARVLSGLCVGLQSPLGPVYVAETSEPRLRGVLLSGISLAVAIGISISHMLGTWLSWRNAAYVSSLFPIFSLIFTIFSSESPAWLLNKKQTTEAYECWKYLRGDKSDEEFLALEKSAQLKRDSILNNNNNNNSKENFIYSLCKSSRFIKPLFITIVFFFTAQFSGVNAVAFYCVQIISNVSNASERPVDPHYLTLILDAIRVAASLLACWLTRRYPRRVLALVSGAGSATSLLVLSIALIFYPGRLWLPASLLIAYTCLVSIGLVPIPWLLCGEIFPADLRGLGSGLSSGFAFVSFFIVVKTGPGMTEALGTAATFGFYGTITTLGTIFIYFFLPETKNKTLKEIEDHFKGKSISKNENQTA